MFENFDFSKIGDMLTKVQEKALEIEKEHENKEFNSKSGGGLVSVRANGKSEILDISIDDSLLNDKNSLQILLMSAINDVLRRVDDDKKDTASQMIGGISGLQF